MGHDGPADRSFAKMGAGPPHAMPGNLAISGRKGPLCYLSRRPT
jgi:hypothetical protein